MLCGFVAGSFATQAWMLSIFWGVLVGMSIGMCGNIVLATGCEWFPERTGLLAGVFSMALGVGSLIFAPASMSLVASLGWRWTFRLYGILYFAVFTLGSFQVRMPPEADMLRRAAPRPAEGEPASRREYTPGQMLRQPSFWFFFMWCVFLTAIGLGLMSQVFTIASYTGMSDMIAALMVSLTGVAHGMGRLLFGTLYDAKGYRFTMGLSTLITLAGGALMLAAAQGGRPVLTAFVFLLLGLGTGGVSPSYSNFARGFFGTVYYQTNLALVNVSMLFAVLLGQYTGSSLYMRTGGFMAMAVAAVVMAVAGMICTLAIRRRA